MAHPPRIGPTVTSSGGFGGNSPALLGLEDLVHDLGAGRDHRAQFTAVDDFGGAGAGMPSQAGDLLDRHALVAHHAHERMAPQAGQQPSARDWIPLLICKNFVELRGFEPLTPPCHGASYYRLACLGVARYEVVRNY